MDKAISLRVANTDSKDHAASNFAEKTEVLSLAKSNRWDLKRFNHNPRISPGEEPTGLTEEQVSRRNELVRSVLKRFDQVLTPPVPADVEQYIRQKNQRDWLPWEEEVIARIRCWRTQLEKIAPELMEELTQAFGAIRNS